MKAKANTMGSLIAIMSPATGLSVTIQRLLGHVYKTRTNHQYHPYRPHQHLLKAELVQAGGLYL